MITIESSLLKAISEFVSPDVVLTNVFYDATNSCIVATDSHVIMMAKVESDGDKSFMIPKEIISALPKGSVEMVEVEGEIFVNCGDYKIVFTVPKGIYPNYKRALPKEIVPEFAHLSPEHVSKIYKFGKKVGEQPFITTNGKRPALISFKSTQIIGAIMPILMRDTEGQLIENITVPQWALIE